MKLENRILLVTGADCGHGPAIIKAALNEGASVIAQSANQDIGESAESVYKHSQVLPLFGDMNIKTNIDTLWADAVAWRGRVDVLVNSADIYTSSPIQSPANWELGWRRNLSINLEGPAELCRHAMQHFKQSGEGIIINLDSRITGYTDTEHLAYHAAKAGLFALSNHISRSHLKHRTLAYVVTPVATASVWSERNCVLAGDYLISAGIPMNFKEDKLPTDIVQITMLLATNQIGKTKGSTDEITDEKDNRHTEPESSKP